MVIFAATDIHGRISFLEEIKDKIKIADLVVLAGDITNFGDEDNAEMVVGEFEKYNKNIVAVYGNCDYPGVERYLVKKGYSISWKWKSIGGYKFIGTAGSLSCPARTPSEFPESDYEEFFNNFKDENQDEEPVILVSHQPPKDTVCDRAYGGVHVGSAALRNFIEDIQPIVVITGHIHEGKGYDRIGRSLIINPGPFKTGNYSIIEIEGSNVQRFELK